MYGNGDSGMRTVIYWYGNSNIGIGYSDIGMGYSDIGMSGYGACAFTGFVRPSIMYLVSLLSVCHI